METIKTAQRCPVLRPADEALDAAVALRKALRRLRRLTQRCSRCRAGLEPSGCARMADYDAVLDIAIEEINQEWGLA